MDGPGRPGCIPAGLTGHVDRAHHAGPQLMDLGALLLRDDLVQRCGAGDVDAHGGSSRMAPLGGVLRDSGRTLIGTFRVSYRGGRHGGKPRVRSGHSVRSRGVREDGRVDLDAFQWLLTDEGQRLLAAAAEASGDSLQAQSALRRTASAGHVAAALTQVELRRRAEAKFGDLADADVLHAGRPRAGHPVAGRHPSGCPGARRGHGDPGRPRLRHRRRPGRVRAGGPHLRRCRRGSRPRRGGGRQPRRARARRRGDGRRRHHRRHLPLRPRVRRPGAPDLRRAGASTSTTGPRPGPSSRRCCTATRA